MTKTTAPNYFPLFHSFFLFSNLQKGRVIKQTFSFNSYFIFRDLSIKSFRYEMLKIQYLAFINFLVAVVIFVKNCEKFQFYIACMENSTIIGISKTTIVIIIYIIYTIEFPYIILASINSQKYLLSTNQIMSQVINALHFSTIPRTLREIQRIR